MIFPTTDTELNTVRVLSVKLSFLTLTKAMRTVKKLKFLGERCPTWLKQFKKELYLKVWLVFFF